MTMTHQDNEAVETGGEQPPTVDTEPIATYRDSGATIHQLTGFLIGVSLTLFVLLLRSAFGGGDDQSMLINSSDQVAAVAGVSAQSNSANIPDQTTVTTVAVTAPADTSTEAVAEQPQSTEPVDQATTQPAQPAEPAPTTVPSTTTTQAPAPSTANMLLPIGAPKTNKYSPTQGTQFCANITDTITQAGVTRTAQIDVCPEFMAVEGDIWDLMSHYGTSCEYVAQALASIISGETGHAPVPAPGNLLSLTMVPDPTGESGHPFLCP